MIELRSDTLTQPTPAMRQAMAEAPVGDDVFGEDPTVNQLEERVATLLGMEAALFVPSGTMSNQIGVRVHCQAGDDFFCEQTGHIFRYEQGAYAQLFGVAVQTVVGEGGLLTPEQLSDLIWKDDIHYPRTRLVCLENTHNYRGGRVLPYEGVAALGTWAADRGLRRHLDGARLWNASVASGVPLADWCQHFDTVSVCFSKSLGAPVGSALCGSAEMIHRARRVRKAMGGGMRQAGVIAAAALYAIENHFDRLKEDHEHAQVLANAVREAPHLELIDDRCDTNIVMLRVDPRFCTGQEFVARLAGRGVACLALGKQAVRLVTHLGVSAGQIQEAADAVRTA